MNKIKTISILLIFIFQQIFLIAQDLNYPVKKISGIEYYIYTVEVQEGLYSISKKFGVKQSEITDLNPEASAGLKAGQVLIVPKKNVSANNVIKQTPKTQFIEHTVLKKQTLFSISRLYNVDIDTIKKYNPQLINGLQVGYVLKIPAVEIPTEKKKNKNIFSIFKKKDRVDDKKTSDKKDAQNYTLHTVKPKETLYSISKLYNVEIEDIIKLNPGSEVTLKTNTELRIPSKSTGNADNNSKTEINNSEQTNDKKSAESNDKQAGNKTIKIAFLLPLMLEQTKVDTSNEKFVDFYAGSLLAVNEAKKRGISFEIYTFDTEKSETKMGEIINNPDLKKVDLIIGPAYTNQVAMIGDFARTNKINTLIPFTSKIYDIDTNPYLYQFNPGISYELKFMTDLLKSKYKKSDIIFAELSDVNISDEGFAFASQLKKELTKQNRDFKVVEITNSESTDWISSLNSIDNNLIFFNTEKYSNINPLMTELKSLSQTNDITYFKQLGWPVDDNSKIKSFFISPFNSDLNPSDLKKYRSSFENNFNWASSGSMPSYDLLGYDLTNYFIHLLTQKGSEFSIGVNNLPTSEGIQSEFKFERFAKYSGFINKQLFSSEK
ncbi:MAG TPA: LysM peptidoglycan-binding domain-containing protein [Paludibacter sp.]|nr:LysM peptidoglycan-binding domain-containing protein [Paludibacter sp.]